MGHSLSPWMLMSEWELSFEVLDAGSASGSGSRSVKFSLVLVTTCVYGPETQYHNQNKNNLT